MFFSSSGQCPAGRGCITVASNSWEAPAGQRQEHGWALEAANTLRLFYAIGSGLTASPINCTPSRQPKNTLLPALAVGPGTEGGKTYYAVPGDMSRYTE